MKVKSSQVTNCHDVSQGFQIQERGCSYKTRKVYMCFLLLRKLLFFVCVYILGKIMQYERIRQWKIFRAFFYIGGVDLLIADLTRCSSSSMYAKNYPFGSTTLHCCDFWTNKDSGCPFHYWTPSKNQIIF